MTVFSSVSFAQLPDGSMAPDWTMTDIEGNEHHLYEYLDNGYAVVLDFSATWCGPCWSYHLSGALEELYINHGPAGMPNVSETTTDDVMVIFIEGDESTTTEDLYGTGSNTTGNWVENTPYPIIDDHAQTSIYMISAWPTIYTICQNGIINESGQISTEAHYELAVACAISSLDYQVDSTSPSVQDGLDENVFTMNVVSSSTMSEELLITVSTDAPADWSSLVSVNGGAAASEITITTSEDMANSIELIVSPGTTAALANYTVEVTSITNPGNPVLTSDYFVAHGITDIIVDKGGVASQFNQDFINGLDLAGNITYGLLDSDKFVEAIGNNQLSEVGHIYYNMGWVFPSFTNELVEALTTFIDGGGNMYVSGQDIGWDTWDSNPAANGTAQTRDFYTDYLSADYQNDGSGSNNQLTPFEDEIFNPAGSSAIIDVHDGNIYPDEFDPIAPATAIFHYNSNASKVGGTRVFENNHKVVYLGIDQGMIADADVRNKVIQISHDWFHGVISGIELDAAFGNMFGEVYPNPSSDYVLIPLDNLTEDVSIQVFDIVGREVFSDKINSGVAQYNLDVNTFNNGVYQVLITNNAGKSTTLSIEVIK